MRYISAEIVHFQDCNGKFRIFDKRHVWCKEAKISVKLDSGSKSSIRVVYPDHTRTYTKCTIISYCDGVNTIAPRKAQFG